MRTPAALGLCASLAIGCAHPAPAPPRAQPDTATKEDRDSKRSGEFICVVCDAEVHTWSGGVDFFDWTAVKARTPVFGKR